MSGDLKAGQTVWVQSTICNHVAGDIYDIEVGELNDIATVTRFELMER